MNVDGLTLQQAESAIRDDFAYWFAIGTEWAVSDCASNPSGSGTGDVATCFVVADTVFERVLAGEDPPTKVRFVIENGVITGGTSAFIGGDKYTTGAAAFKAWVHDKIETGAFDAASVPCNTTGIYPETRIRQPPTGECSQWIADRLTEWQADVET